MGCFMAFATAYRRWLERLACAVDDLRAQQYTFDNEIRKQEMLQGQVRGEGVKIMSDKVKRLEKLIQTLPLVEHKRTSLFSNFVNFIRHVPTIYKIKEAVIEAEVLTKFFVDMDKQDIKRLLQSYTDEKIFDIWVDNKRRLLSLQCLLKLVKDETSGTVPMIGIHGIGGVGKTALMRKLHDAEMATLPGEPDTMIIWIDISMDCNVDHIQGKIADVLNLKKKRCILFLDDVWDALVFEKIRIPISDYSEHYQKIIVIFTTRNFQLCLNMNARILQVPLLDETESRELLKKHLRADAQIPETGLPIMSILCDGLPLAIEVLAREVIGKKLISVRDLLEDWHLGNNTLLALKLSAKVADARDILGEFRYRFGSLTNEEISCLLYCSIIDLETVTLEDIVNQLVGEENLPLLSSSLCTSKEEIHAIIKRLELMSLLQRYGNDGGEHLKMHNFIREVLSLEYHRESLSIKSINASRYLNWETAKRVEISLQDAEKLLGTPHLYLNLHSLVINKRCATDVMTKISRTVFTCMPALLVLDLSHTKITVLPETIRCLTELQYLSLSYTELKAFPLELRYLKKLRQLYLRATSVLNFIPRDSFSGFLRLQALDFVASQYWENQGNNDPSQLKFEDFKNMHYLEEFGITITGEASLDGLLELNKLCQVTTSLVLRFIKDKIKFSQILKIMSKLKKLQIESSRMCNEIHVSDEQLVCLEELGLKNCDFSAIVIGESSFNKLRHLTIGNCNNLCDIEWARFAPHLKYLDISSCDGMKKLFECQTTDIIRFSNLESLKLSCMSSLKIVCSGSLALPSLQELKIDGCGELEEHLVHKKCGESTKPMIFGDGYVWQARSDDMLLPTDISISLSSNDCSNFHRRSNAESEIQVTGPLNPQDSEIPMVTSEIEMKLAAIAGSSWTTNRPEKWSAKLDKLETSATQETNPAEESESPEVDDTPSSRGKNAELPLRMKHILFGYCFSGSPRQSSITDEASPFSVDKKGRLSKLRTVVEDGTLNTGKSGYDMTEPGTSQSRDDEIMRFRLESADNEGKRFRLRWLESPDYEDIGTPLETSGVWVDLKDRLSKLEKLVGDESNNSEQIIGILGMVGVGKTELMRRLYEEMTLNYDRSESLVTWIQVSGNPSVIYIQDQMAKALNLDLQNNNDVRARASCISRALGTKKRCILLLDDVADALDFEGVGIPTRNEDWHEKKRVFIFTTRYSQVCFDMNAQIFEVPLLDTWESYELFKRHLSVSVDSSFEFKHKLQEECHGLPLAIQLLAREAEKRSTNISCDGDLSLTEMYRVNRDALNGALTAIFKPTHGRLTDEDISCLIYYPLVNDMEHEICISALVGKESNPDPSSSLSTVKREMNSRMKKLESMCLLRRRDRLPEDGTNYVEERNNKLHNFIKQTIMMGCHPDHVTVTSATECQFESWERARCVRISLPSNIRRGTELPDVSPICSKLHSLIIASGFIVGVPVGIPSNFFAYMPVLRVLDLSGTDIDILPISVKYLLELQYLNLSFTHIESLPKELGNHKKLRQLYLKRTPWLENVPRDVFNGLAKLQSLHFFGSSFKFKKRKEYLPQLELKDLEGMHQLEEFSATIDDETFLRGLLTSNLLRKATVSLELKHIGDDGDLVSQALETLSKMKEFSIIRSRVHMIHLSAGKQVSLEKLIIRNCHSFSKIDVGDATCSREPPSMAPFHHALLHLEIIYCPQVRDIAWVQLAPSLRFLTVAECNGIRELVVHHGSALEIEPWSQLEYFQLIGNKNLEIIYSGSLSLPSLSRLFIHDCPKLRKHHLQTNSTDSATIVIDDDYWEWTAVPDDLLLPRNIKPTVSYLPDDTCAPIEKATFSEQFQSEGMSSSKRKKPAFWTKLKGSCVAKGMTLIPLRKKHQGMSPSKRKKPAVWRKPFSVAKAMNCCRGRRT